MKPNVSRRNGDPEKRRSQRAYRPAAVALLEPRMMMAANLPATLSGVSAAQAPAIRVTLSNGTLKITGSRQSDFIGIILLSQRVSIGRTNLSYDRSAIRRIEIDGGDLDDFISIQALDSTKGIAAVIRGGRGNDSLVGGSAKDSVDGGDGNDTLSGGSGDNTLREGRGDDLIHGYNDKDLIYGDSGNDQIVGGDGDDFIIAGMTHEQFVRQDNDLVDGGARADTIVGRSGNDTLRGGADDDTLEGDRGDDLVEGGDGDDYLSGFSGIDSLYGNAGADTFIFERGQSSRFSLIRDFNESEGDQRF